MLSPLTMPAAHILRSPQHMLFSISLQCKESHQFHEFEADQCIKLSVICCSLLVTPSRQVEHINFHQYSLDMQGWASHPSVRQKWGMSKLETNVDKMRTKF